MQQLTINVTGGLRSGGAEGGGGARGATALASALGEKLARRSPAHKNKNKNWKEHFLILSRRKKREGKKDSARIN